MMRRAQNSIRSIGLEAHVNKYLEEKGSEWRYSDFVRMIDVPPQKRPSARSLAKIFNVTYPTIEKWTERFYEQKRRGKS